MKHFIIGTAGHVDHGKTSLIKAMTGIDADRLIEEKKRGITIDLGFASLKLPHFDEVGIVDVPGHEKFIKNMLAGAGGIDYAVLVVAADEGVMPQTREHLDILTLLNMKHGMVVITKTDLVDRDFVELVEEDIREEIKGTFLENSRILPVSSYTGEGIETLKQILDEELLKLEEKDERIPFRLPVDRVFTLTGFGTIVTGTVIEGKLEAGKEYLLYPELIPAKVRGIQVHGKTADKAFAGQRAAVNLAGIAKEEIKRGYVMAPPESMDLSMILDVRLDILPDSPFEVKNNSKVHFYHGSSELIAKAVLMDRDILKPGESCYAQLRFREPLAAKKGDMFVIRFFSPVVTVGGGTILDACPRKKKRNQSAAIKSMEIKEKGNDREQLYQAISENIMKFCTLPELVKRASLNNQTVKNNRNKLLSDGEIIELENETYITKAQEQKFFDHISEILKEFHKENRLKEGMPLPEFRSKLLGKGRERDADSLLHYWESRKLVKERENCVSLYSFKVKKLEDDKKIASELEALYENAGFTLPVLAEVSAGYPDSRRFNPVLSSLLKEGVLIRLDERYLIHRKWYETAREQVIAYGKGTPDITLGGYRDHLDVSRKVALALLDYFDKQGITRKNGDVRTLFRI